MKDHKTRLVIVSICLNESETIGNLIKLMPDKISGVDEIIKLVVDDGSTDDTAKIASDNGAIVVSNGKQKRLALSFQIAVEKALELGADIMANIDGDMQYNPKDIPLLVKPIIDGKADFVAANRFIDTKTGKIRKPENMPSSKYYANKLGSFILGKLSKEKFADVTSGFRAYNRKALMNINLGTGYTYTQESFQVLALKKLNIVQVPTPIKYYPGRKSRVVTNFLSFLINSGVNIIRSFRDYAPLSFFGVFGLIVFALSLILGTLPAINYIGAGSISPYKAFGIASLYLFSLSIIIWLLGLLADIFARVLSNQEKILYNLKKIRFDK